MNRVQPSPLLWFACAIFFGTFGLWPGLRAEGLGPIFSLEGGTQLATRPDGTTFLVETLNRCLEPDVYALYREVRVARIEPGATNQGPFQVRADMTSPGCRFPAYNPDVAVNSSNVVLSFTEKSVVIFGEPHAYDIAYSLVDTNGTPGTPGYAAADVDNTATRSWQDSAVRPRIAMNRFGEFAVVWFSETESNASSAVARLFGSDGQALGTNRSFTLNQTHRAFQPVVGIADDRRSVYAWEDAEVQKYGFVGAADIYGRLADRNGEPLGTEFRINTTTNCGHSDAEIAVAGDGSFVAVWAQRASDSDGIYLQRFDAAGSRVGLETRVSRSGLYPQVAMGTDGRLVVAWQGGDGDGSGVFLQRVASDGSFLGHELWVNEGATNSQTNPLLGMSDEGTCIVKWSEGAASFARWIPWDATNASRILGPWIQSSSPAAYAEAPLSNITVTFDRLMNPGTFAPTNAQLFDPMGRAVALASVQTTDNQSFALTFLPQHLRGDYRLSINPGIRDVAGALVDQDANGVGGEASDVVQRIITVASAAVVVPFADDFESSSSEAPGSWWAFSTSPGATIDVLPTIPPVRGTSSLRINGGPASATLTVNLAGATNASLDFWALQTVRSFGYFGAADVSISEDGAKWHTVASPYAYADGWHHFFVDLDAAVQGAGIRYGERFQIRFENHPNYYTPQEWFWDDIRVSVGNLNTMRLTSPAWLGDHTFQFQLSGGAGREFVIQASNDLVSWVPMATNWFPSDGRFSITDPAATNYSRRFYRAVSP